MTIRAQAASALVSLASLTLALMSSGCSSSADSIAVPQVDQIAPAIAAVESQLGDGQRYFEVSATLDEVGVVVAQPTSPATTSPDPQSTTSDTTSDATSDTTSDAISGAAYEARRYTFRDGELSGPESLGPATGQTFLATDLAMNPGRVFSGIRHDMPESIITDFAATGGPNGTMIYDTTILSDRGGELRVRVDENGTVLSAMAN